MGSLLLPALQSFSSYLQSATQDLYSRGDRMVQMERQRVADERQKKLDDRNDAEFERAKTARTVSDIARRIANSNPINFADISAGNYAETIQKKVSDLTGLLSKVDLTMEEGGLLSDPNNVSQIQDELYKGYVGDAKILLDGNTAEKNQRAQSTSFEIGPGKTTILKQIDASGNIINVSIGENGRLIHQNEAEALGRVIGNKDSKVTEEELGALGYYTFRDKMAKEALLKERERASLVQTKTSNEMQKEALELRKGMGSEIAATRIVAATKATSSLTQQIASLNTSLTKDTNDAIASIVASTQMDEDVRSKYLQANIMKHKVLGGSARATMSDLDIAIEIAKENNQPELAAKFSAQKSTFAEQNMLVDDLRFQRGIATIVMSKNVTIDRVQEVMAQKMMADPSFQNLSSQEKIKQIEQALTNSGDGKPESGKKQATQAAELPPFYQLPNYTGVTNSQVLSHFRK